MTMESERGDDNETDEEKNTHRKKEKKGGQMTMAYAILRFQKLSTINQIHGAERHATNREKLKHRSRPENKNIVIQNPRYKDLSLWDAYEKASAPVTRKIQENAVRIIEVIMAYSPEYDKYLDKKKWVHKNHEWLKGVFGVENVITLRYDKDEKTDHLHAFIVPIKKMKNKKGKDIVKLCAREFIGGREKLSELQTSYANDMKELGLSRGICYTATRDEQEQEIKAKKRYTPPKKHWAQEEAKALADEILKGDK